MSTKKKSKKTAHKTVKTFADHIGELRIRVMWVALVFVLTSALAYNFRDQLVSLVLAPLGQQKLIYLTPAGGFSFIFQITMYAGAVVTAPFAVYHLYRFVHPALPAKATRFSIRIVLAATTLMLIGVSFGYFVAIPAALHFLTTFASSYIQATLTADSYLSFVVAYVVGLGLIFQLPLLLIFWNWINPMKPGKLLSSQRFVVLFAFIAAAMITPTPDIFNQSLIAVPIILIYQVGVVAVFIMNRGHRKAAKVARKKQLQPVMFAPEERELEGDYTKSIPTVAPVVPKAAVYVTPVTVHKPSRAHTFDMVQPRRAVPVQPRPAPALQPRPLPRLQRAGLSLDGVSRFSSNETA